MLVANFIIIFRVNYYNKYYTALKMEIQSADPHQQLFYCFNPKCYIANRVYSQFNRMYQDHHKCSGWIISSSSLFSPLQQKNKHSIQETTQSQDELEIVNNLDYINYPIKSLLVMEKVLDVKDKNIDDVLSGNNRQINPLKILQFNFSILRDKIEIALDKVYEKILNRIKIISKRSVQTLQAIRNLAQIKNISEASNQIRNSVTLMEYKILSQSIGNLTFVNNYQAFDQIQKIQECVQKLSEAFWREQPQSLKKQRFGMNKAFDKIKQFAQDTSIQLNQKIQLLASMHGTAVPAAIVDNEKQSAKNLCWICNIEIQGYGNSIRQRKGDALKKLFSHLLSIHIKEIGLKYFDKQLRFNAFAISFQEFVHEIQSQSYKKFILVDSQNAPKSDHHLRYASQADVYVIHVVSHLRQTIAKGKYILAHSKGKDSADILIIIMVAMICQSKCKFKKLNSKIKDMTNQQQSYNWQVNNDCEIVLVTRDHFGVTLQQNFRGIGVSITIDKLK